MVVNLAAHGTEGRGCEAVSPPPLAAVLAGWSVTVEVTSVVHPGAGSVTGLSSTIGDQALAGRAAAD